MDRFLQTTKQKTSIMRDLRWVQTLKKISLEPARSFSKSIILFPVTINTRRAILFLKEMEKLNVYVTGARGY